MSNKENISSFRRYFEWDRALCLLRRIIYLLFVFQFVLWMAEGFAIEAFLPSLLWGLKVWGFFMFFVIGAFFILVIFND